MPRRPRATPPSRTRPLPTSRRQLAAETVVAEELEAELEAEEARSRRSSSRRSRRSRTSVEAIEEPSPSRRGGRGRAGRRGAERRWPRSRPSGRGDRGRARGASRSPSPRPSCRGDRGRARGRRGRRRAAVEDELAEELRRAEATSAEATDAAEPTNRPLRRSLPPRIDPAGRRRDHRRHRRREERGAGGIRAPRRRDRLERRDRPRAAAATTRSRRRSSSGSGTASSAPDGSLDRGAIATVVFNDPDALARLEELLHPLVSAEYLRWREQLAGAAGRAARLRDRGAAPLRGRLRRAVRQGRRRHRARRSCAATRSAAAVERAGAAACSPTDEKVARADYAYVNAGSLDGARSRSSRG